MVEHGDHVRSRQTYRLDQPAKQHRLNGSSMIENSGVGGSSPSPLTKFFDWCKGEPIGLPECPYSYRWKIDLGSFSIRLHQWLKSDDSRAFHDHSWWFVTLVLWGGYTDVSTFGDDILSIGSIRYRKAEHKHTVKVNKPGTLTLLLTGKPKRRWGFWVDGKLIKRDKYFAVWGHHPCDEGNSPIRRMPDRTRI